MKKDKQDPWEKLEAEAPLEKLGRVALRAPEEQEVLWSVFDFFSAPSHCGWKRTVSTLLKASSLIDFTEDAKVPLKIIYLCGMAGVAGIPRY